MLKDVQFTGTELRAVSMVTFVFFGFASLFYAGLATLQNGVFLAVTVLSGLVFAYMMVSIAYTVL